MSLKASMQRLVSPPPRNVGGGDLLTRLFAGIILLFLIAMIVPQTKTPFALAKIALLVSAELGLVSLMLGLFLRSKTYFAGLQLFFASLLMLWMTGRNYPYVGILIGLMFIGVGIATVVTRKSRLNAFLQVSSLRVPLQELEAAAAIVALSPEGQNASALKTQAEGPR